MRVVVHVLDDAAYTRDIKPNGNCSLFPVLFLSFFSSLSHSLSIPSYCFCLRMERMPRIIFHSFNPFLLPLNSTPSYLYKAAPDTFTANINILTKLKAVIPLD